MQKVVLATGNAGKVRELASLLSDFGLDVVAQTELGVDSAEETGLTFIENAILKARHAAKMTGLPAIADDSPPIVCHGSWPGVITRQAAGNGGFGYDPIFFVPSEGKTAAELTREEKSAISHRGQALKLLLDALRNG